MTPPAATVAGRALPRSASPRHHRRVSGPRRSGRSRSGAAGRRVAAADVPLAARLLARLRTLADSRLLDRILRGRLWIGIVAAMLMGIVFMQVTMLSLNAGIGRAVDRSADLERENTTLRAQVSRMESSEALDGVVGRLGMVQPADGTIHYLRAGRGEAARAAQRMTAPSGAAVTTTQAAQAAAPSPDPAGSGTVGSEQPGIVGSGTVGSGTVTTAPPAAAATTPTTSGGATATAPPAGTTAAPPATGTTSSAGGAAAPIAGPRQ